MSDHAGERAWQHRADPTGPNHRPGAESIETYEEDDRVVLFDADNPLAWVETTVAVPLEELP